MTDRLSTWLQTNGVVFLCIVAVLVVVTVLIPQSSIFELPAIPSTFGPLQEGRVDRIVSDTEEQTERGAARTQVLEVALDGETVTLTHSRVENEAGPPPADVGDRVLLQALPGTEGTPVYYIVDYVRRGALVAFAVVFAVMVVAIGGSRGVASLLGLAASILVIVRFVIPGILAGFSPVVISVTGAAVIMVATLFLSHGVNWKTSTALAGTVVALGVTALMASMSIAFAKLSGIAGEEAATLQILSQGEISAGGLLLGGIIIGALGVLDDVTVAQASAVFELRRANARLRRRDLFRRAMNVGRDHIASTVNTLALAYAGASLPLLAILATQAEPVGTLLNREFMATEILRTLAGSVGIVAAVPITTFLAATVAGRAAGATAPSGTRREAAGS